MYNVPDSPRFEDRTQMRVLDQMYLDLKSGSTAVSHVMGLINGTTMAHTTQLVGTESDLRYDDREYYINKYGEDNYKWCRRYVTDEELESVIIGETVDTLCMIVLHDPRQSLVAEAQYTLVTLGYDLGDYGPEGNGVDGKYGSKTFNAVTDFQNDYEIEVAAQNKGYITMPTAIGFSIALIKKVHPEWEQVVTDMADIGAIAGKYKED